MLMRLVRVLILFLVAALLTIGALAQVTFRAESPVITPGTAGCVQVGLFVSLPSTAMPPDWGGLVATLDYDADPGVLVTGVSPWARISNFAPVSSPGLTDPATSQPPHSTGGGLFMDPCQPDALINSVVLGGGMNIPFIPGTSMAMVSETVSPMSPNSGRISLLSGGSFDTPVGQDHLFAVLTFMVTGNPGGIRITFVNPMPGSNALLDLNEMVVEAATSGGVVQFASSSTAVPTLSQWGIIAFLSGLLLSALVFLRRRPTVT